MSTNFQNISSGINLGSLATDPSGAKAGDFYFNSTSNKFRMYDGTSWADVVTGAVVSGANQTLSNLTSPVAFNQNLTPDSNATRNVGSSANLVNQVWTSQLLAVDPLSGGNTLGISKRDASSSFPEASNSMSVASGSTSLPISIQTTNSAANDANATTDVHVLTGNKTSGTGNSGSIVLKTGTSAGGTRGTLEVDASLMNVNNAEIRNVLNPTLPQSAATKVYVDTARQQFIANGLADNGTTGWATYADAAGTSPVDGTGGTAAITFTTTTLSPLSGNTSFILTKGASNRQGQGASYDFTIDNANLAKVQEISFDYIIDSGTFVAGNPADRTSAGDSSVTVWIYDVTNNVLIQPSSYRLYSNSTATPDKFSAYFQTASNSTSYRLILHIGRTETTAYTLKVDNIEVQPSEYVYGTPITDWQNYTPTFIGFGTVTNINVYWRRVGSNIELRGRFQVGTPTATVAQLSLPNNYKTTIGGPGLEIVGSYIRSSTAINHGGMIFSDTSQVSGNNFVTFGPADTFSGTSNDAYQSANGTAVANASNLISIQITLPIQGLLSSVQMSDSADTRVVDFVGNSASAVSNTSTNVSYTTLKDSHGAWTGSTYVVPVSGDYQIGFNGSTTSSGGDIAFVYIDTIQTVKLGQTATTNGTISGSTIIPNLRAGQIISIRGSAGGSWNSNATERLSISRISGPSAIAPIEPIIVRYSTSAGTSINTSATTIPFATKIQDTHGAWNGTVFTAPASGTYMVSASLVSAGGTALTVRIEKNSIPNRYFYNGTRGAGGSTLVQLIAGETIRITSSLDSGTSTLDVNALYNQIEIARIGL